MISKIKVIFRVLKIKSKFSQILEVNFRKKVQNINKKYSQKKNSNILLIDFFFAKNSESYCEYQLNFLVSLSFCLNSSNQFKRSY